MSFKQRLKKISGEDLYHEHESYIIMVIHNFETCKIMFHIDQTSALKVMLHI